MTITLPLVAGLLLVVGGAGGLWQAVRERETGRQWLGLALFSAAFLCIGVSSATSSQSAVLGGIFSMVGALTAASAFVRVRIERRRMDR